VVDIHDLSRVSREGACQTTRREQQADLADPFSQLLRTAIVGSATDAVNVWVVVRLQESLKPVGVSISIVVDESDDVLPGT
jgi:hypothetical protein